MIKKIGFVCFPLGFSVVLHAQSPLGVRGREWNEQDGYAIVEGVNLHYWLYSFLIEV